jgi:hypothetical protein
VCEETDKACERRDRDRLNRLRDNKKRWDDATEAALIKELERRVSKHAAKPGV